VDLPQLLAVLTDRISVRPHTGQIDLHSLGSPCLPVTAIVALARLFAPSYTLEEIAMFVSTLKVAVFVAAAMLMLGTSWVQAGDDEPLLKGHKDAVRFLSFSPDGKRLVSVDKGRVLLWEVTTGKHTELSDTGLTNPGRPVWSPRGEKIAIVFYTSGENAVLTLWDASKPTSLPKKENTRTASSDDMGFSPDGKYLIRMEYAYDATTLKLLEEPKEQKHAPLPEDAAKRIESERLPVASVRNRGLEFSSKGKQAAPTFAASIFAVEDYLGRDAKPSQRAVCYVRISEIGENGYLRITDYWGRTEYDAPKNDGPVPIKTVGFVAGKSGQTYAVGIRADGTLLKARIKRDGTAAPEEKESLPTLRDRDTEVLAARVCTDGESIVTVQRYTKDDERKGDLQAVRWNREGKPVAHSKRLEAPPGQGELLIEIAPDGSAYTVTKGKDIEVYKVPPEPTK
jgi:hypothetical protein